MVLVAHAAAFVVLWRHQARHDGDARAIAAWMDERHEERVAWPHDARSAVPALLDAGVTPILTDDPAPAQQLVVNNTRVVVTRHAEALDDLTLDEFRAGPFVARLVDLERAAQVPLRTGEVVGVQIARPYVFSPLDDSRPLRNAKPMRVFLRLAPGTYALTAEAFVPRGRGVMELLATAGFFPLARKQFPLTAVVERRFALGFRVPPGPVQKVGVAFVVRRTEGGRPAYLDAWQLERTSAR